MVIDVGVDEAASVGPAALCAELYPRLVGSLRLYLGDLATAEEIAQDALSRVVERWPEVARMDHPEAWAWRVAFNLASSSLRRRGAERRALRRLEGRTPGRHQDADGGRPDPTDVVVVREALAGLPPRQRRAVVLRYYDDLPLTEIATVMGCRPGTVKAHLHKALITLRRQGLTDGPPSSDGRPEEDER